MLPLGFGPLRTILCLGAHADDIEIGCGGTLLRLREEYPDVQIHWVVFSGDSVRAAEARGSGRRFLGAAAADRVQLLPFRDRYFPTQWEEIKDHFDAIRRDTAPELIFTHRRDDAHQDHRVVSELTWCAFRNHWILEYEIPKFEGDLGNPNVLVPLSAELADRKANWIFQEFPSQQTKSWFTAETFLALARIRGIEAAAAEGYAEGFYSRKLVL